MKLYYKYYHRHHYYHRNPFSAKNFRKVFFRIVHCFISSEFDFGVSLVTKLPLPFWLQRGMIWRTDYPDIYPKPLS
jgi:hypothetical protein